MHYIPMQTPVEGTADCSYSLELCHQSCSRIMIISEDLDDPHTHEAMRRPLTFFSCCKSNMATARERTVLAIGGLTVCSSLVLKGNIGVLVCQT